MSLASPQLLDHVPPRAQQLSLPALLVTHLRHPLLLLTAEILVVVGVSMEECTANKHNAKDTNTDASPSRESRHIVRITYAIYSQTIDPIVWFPHNSNRKIQLQTYFASLNTLGPCMIKFRIASISAIFEPTTAASATAAFTCLVGGALRAYRTDRCCRRHDKSRRHSAWLC